MKITKGIQERIDKVFEWGKETGVKFNPTKSGNDSNSTLDTYASVVKTYNNWLQANHGISIDRAKPRHAYEYVTKIAEQVKTGERSAWTLKKIPHAIHAFQEMSGASGAFKRQCKVGDKRVMLEFINSEGIQRRSSEAHSLKANDNDYQKVKEEMDQSTSRYKHYTMEIHQSQRQLGLRVHEAVKMQVKDIDFTNKTVRVVGKGGLERFVPIRDDRYLQHLKELCAEKKGGSDVFRVQNQKGNPPSRIQRQKIVKAAVRKAADAADVARNGKAYTTHSGRKAYAQSRVDELKRLKTKTIEKEFARRCAEDSTFQQKAAEQLKNIRVKIKKDKQASRLMNKKEMILFIVSCELGHFRLDVMRYYVDY